MRIVRTDKWLLDLYDNPVELCEKLVTYFEGATATEIYHHLLFHGMYCYPLKHGRELVQLLQKNQIWELVKTESQQLQDLWDGPNIPVFILPSNSHNKKMEQELNGKSGLAFNNKLFLFISKNNMDNEIKALYTHEYNHVCRLSHYPKKEEDYVLLDTIILEGLAEHAVLERIGEEYLASWTTYYSENLLKKLWKELVRPNINILKMEHKHQNILYGSHRYPNMLGYCVGYYLVTTYVKQHKVTSKELLEIESEEIAQM